MKKIIIPLSIAFALIMIALSCKKNPGDSDPVNNQSNQISEFDRNIEQKILAFKGNIEKPLKDGNGYLIDTAVYYIEALINYTYSTIGDNYEYYSFDSTFFDVTLSNGLVTPAEASAVYDDIIDSLTVIYDNLPTQNLHLIFSDVFSRDSTAGSVTFEVISSFGYGPVISLGSFGEDDHWKFGWGQYNNGGYCDGPNNGEDKYSDAAIQIGQRIRQTIPTYSPRIYPTGLVSLLILAWGDVQLLEDRTWYYCDFTNENDQYPRDNYFEYLMFYNQSDWPNFHYCMSPEDPDEMNFYLNGTYTVFTDIIYDCLGEVLANKDLSSVLMVGNNSDTYPVYWYLHYSTNTYGNWIETREPPASFE